MSDSSSMPILGILDQYDSYAIYNIESVEHANIVALGEGHKDNNCTQLNGRYISCEAKKGPVAIFVEGCLSMKRLTLSISHLKGRLQIDADIPDENIQVFGWDIDTEILELGQEHFQKELVQFTQKANALLEKRSTLDKELTICKNDIQKIVPEFEIEKFETVGRMWFRQVQDADYSRFIERLNHYVAMYAKREEVNQECKSLSFPQPTFVKETLSLRAGAMAQTARSVAKLQSEGKLPPLAIFIAGIAHLRHPTSDSEHLLQLKAWQDEIACHRAAVLIEKEVHKKFLEESV